MARSLNCVSTREDLSLLSGQTFLVVPSGETAGLEVVAVHDGARITHVFGTTAPAPHLEDRSAQACSGEQPQHLATGRPFGAKAGKSLETRLIHFVTPFTSVSGYGNSTKGLSLAQQFHTTAPRTGCKSIKTI
jgi:hypothetical protein